MAIVVDDVVLGRRLRLALAQTPEHVVVAEGRDELLGPVDVIIQDGSAQQIELDRVAGEPAVVEVVRSTSVRGIREALARGAQGIVAETELEMCLGDTVRAVLAGQLVLPAAASALIARPALSPREKQVLGLIVIGLSNAEIAAKLHLADATVKSHLSSSFRKLGVRTRSEAAQRILDPSTGLGLGILGITDEAETAA